MSRLCGALLSWAFLLAFSGVPHSGQNLAVGRICWPQLGQSRTNGVPHSSQNLAPSAFSPPQLPQRMLPLYPVARARARKTGMPASTAPLPVWLEEYSASLAFRGRGSPARRAQFSLHQLCSENLYRASLPLCPALDPSPAQEFFPELLVPYCCSAQQACVSSLL